MKRSANAIVGKSDQNLSSAMDMVPDLHVRFSQTNENEHLLVSDDNKRKVKKGARSRLDGIQDFDRQLSTIHSKIDQFQAARYGNIEPLQQLYKDNRENYKVIFDRLDPETKLTALHYATRFHHLHICQFLIEQCDVNVNKAGEDGMTPLHYVARFRVEKDNLADSYEKVVRYLIQHGASVNARDVSDSTPLHHACERDNVLCAEILISAQAAIEACDRQKMHPLHGAAFYGCLATTHLLIERGADVLAIDDTSSIPFAHACRNSHYVIIEMFFQEFKQHKKLNEVLQAMDSEGNTLLHLATASANFQLIELLLSNNIDPLAKREDGQTAIHLCGKTDSIEILEKLLEAGGDISGVDMEEETILHKAATHNKENILQYVLTKKKDKEFIQRKNMAGVTALLLAASLGHSPCVALLLEAGADMLNDRDKRERSSLYLASMRNHIKTLEVLLTHSQSQHGSEKTKLALNEIDRFSRTSLHAAAELGHVDAVRELINSGASLTIKDDDEHTPLMLCCKKNRLDVLNVFIDFINAHYQSSRDKQNIFEERDDGSNTALHLAAAEGHSSIVKLLLEQNCDFQSRNMISWLPIHCAAERGRYNSVRVLLENRSPVDPIDKNQQTPLHLAARSGHAEVVKLLLKNGAQINQRTSNFENCLDLAINANQHNVAFVLIEHHEWEALLRNAKYDEQTKRWDTPLRKLIRKMPDIALIVLNKCFTEMRKGKNEPMSSSNETTENKTKKKKTRKKSAQEGRLEAGEQLHNTTDETSGLTKDETQRQKLAFVYKYEFLDDQYALRAWAEGQTENIYEPDGRLYPHNYEQKLDRKSLRDNHPFTLMVENNREILLDHPLVHSLLNYKWTLYARYVYYSNFLFYLFFVASLTTYVFITFPPYSFSVTHDLMEESTCSELCSAIKTNHTTEISDLKTRITAIHVFQWLVITLASIQIIKESFQIVTDRLEYIKLENAVELSAFILAILFTVDLNSCSREFGYRCVIQWQLGALGVFLTWFALVLFIQKFPTFGIFVVMLTEILRTFSRFFLVFFLFIIGFALAFHMLLQNHNPFQHFGNSLLKTCVMMIGEFEYEGIFHGDNPSYFGITYFFFIIFVIVMSIIIMNLLVGLAVDDIASVMRVATVKRLEMRVRLTLDVERQLPKRKFFPTIQRFRTVYYEESYWFKLLYKIFHVKIKTEFDRNFTRLRDYGLIQIEGNEDSKSATAATNLPKMPDKTKPTMSTSTNAIGVSSDWVTSMYTQISTKYSEFNRHMADLKVQQDKINNILQQFPTTNTSRHNSNLTFLPTT